jgi:hypothetical protein
MMGDPVTMQMPVQLTPEMIRAVRDDPLTSIEDKEQWYIRLGWLICAYDVLIETQQRAHTK